MRVAMAVTTAAHSEAVTGARARAAVRAETQRPAITAAAGACWSRVSSSPTVSASSAGASSRPACSGTAGSGQAHPRAVRAQIERPAHGRGSRPRGGEHAGIDRATVAADRQVDLERLTGVADLNLHTGISGVEHP